jgi:RNA polymerase sigma-70 factor (ECF subfamily)
MMELTAGIGETVGGEAPESLLLARAKSGDLDAFEQLMRLYERRVFGLALRLTDCVEDARDVTQETFLRMHRNLSHVSAERSLGPWLLAVAANASRDLGRVRKRSPLVAMDVGTTREARDPRADPEIAASGREQERHLRAGLMTLPEKDLAALLLREMEGLSSVEVAGILGSSPVRVRSQISTARVKLRKFLARGRKEAR